MRATAATLLLAIVAGTAAAEPLSDPTRPLNFAGPRPAAAAPAGPAAPALQSTLVSPQRKSAVISGKAVKVGDTFQGAVVTDITAYEVRLSKGGRETRLRLLPKLIKEKGTVE